MGCGTVSIREEVGKVQDIRIDRPCDSAAIIKGVGKGLNTGMYAIAGDLGGGTCGVFGAGGSGNGHVVSSVTSKDSGTPYAITTIRTLG